MSKNKFTRGHRLLHWGLALFITVLFLTGFLRMTFMDKKQVAGIIRDKLPEMQPEQAIALAKSIRAPMWEWHIYAAYGLILLFVGRIVYMLIKGIKFPNPFKANTTLSDKFHGMVYILFYAFVGLNILTGFYHLWGSNPALKGLSGTVHKWAIYWFPIFILIHFAGFIIMEVRKDKGIVSKMIGGDFDSNKTGKATSEVLEETREEELGIK